MMYSTVGTLALNGVDVLRWLTAWLAACADNGGCASPWLRDGAERRNELAMTGAVECRYHARLLALLRVAGPPALTAMP